MWCGRVFALPGISADRSFTAVQPGLSPFSVEGVGCVPYGASSVDDNPISEALTCVGHSTDCRDTEK